MTFFVKWEEKVTESGIQIAGPSTIERMGEVLSSQCFPIQNGGQIGFMVAFIVRRLPDNKILVIDGNTCEWAEDPNAVVMLENKSDSEDII